MKGLKEKEFLFLISIQISHQYFNGSITSFFIMSSEEAVVDTPQSVEDKDKTPEEERKDEGEKVEVQAPTEEIPSDEMPPAPSTEFDENNKKVSEEPLAIDNPPPDTCNDSPPVKDSEELSVHNSAHTSTHASAHESQHT